MSLMHRSSPFRLVLCTRVYWWQRGMKVASSIIVKPRVDEVQTLDAVVSAASRKIL